MFFLKVARTNVPSLADGGPRDRFYPCFSTMIVPDSSCFKMLTSHDNARSSHNSLDSTNSARCNGGPVPTADTGASTHAPIERPGQMTLAEGQRVVVLVDLDLVAVVELGVDEQGVLDDVARRGDCAANARGRDAADAALSSGLAGLGHAAADATARARVAHHGGEEDLRAAD